MGFQNLLSPQLLNGIREGQNFFDCLIKYIHMGFGCAKSDTYIDMLFDTSSGTSKLW